jgi:hypothetical protein
MAKKAKVNEVEVKQNLVVKINEIKSTMEYTNRDKYEFTELCNREVNSSHINSLKETFFKHGVAGVVIKVIETEAYGRKTRIIADGQHSCLAAEQLGYPLDIMVLKMVEDTRENIVEYVAMLNNSQKGWKIKNYLGVHKHNKEILFLTEKIKETKLSLSDLCIIYLQDAKQMNTVKKGGKIIFLDIEDSTKMLDAVMMVKKVIPNSSNCRRALYRILTNKVKGKGKGAYKKFANAILQKSKEPLFKFNGSETVFFDELLDVYNDTFN